MKKESFDLTRESFAVRFEELATNVETIIKGKRDVIRMVLIALLAEGHVLLEDMPGTGKTMMARALSQTFAARSNRVQCTPDLLPSDVTGAPVLDMQSREFVFREGPVFANVLVIDEINRATPKTQSALLEAMQEARVTSDRVTYDLPKPFVVLATQNPIELAGTFPLPEAQLDRFLFQLSVGYADHAAEAQLMRAHQSSDPINAVTAISSAEEIMAMIEWARGVVIGDPVLNYMIDIVQMTRSDPSLMIGASSRASLAMMRATRVLAASQGREEVYPDDVKAVLLPVLAHRLILTPDAQLRDETVAKVIERIMGRVKPPLGLSSAPAPAPVAAGTSA